MNNRISESVRDIIGRARTEASKAPSLKDFAEKEAHVARLEKADREVRNRDLANRANTPFAYKRLWKKDDTKNKQGELETNRRRVNSKQIKKSIERHNAKVNGESTKKPLNPYRDKIPQKNILGSSYKTDDERVKNSIERHNKKTSTKISEACYNDIIELVVEQLIEEGRLFDEETGRPTKEAGELAKKHMAIQKSIRRNADKNVKPLEKAEDEARNARENAWNKYANSLDNEAKNYRATHDARNSFEANKNKLGASHPATIQAWNEYRKHSNKASADDKKSESLKKKWEDASFAANVADDKSYVNMKKQNNTRRKVDNLRSIIKKSQG